MIFFAVVLLIASSLLLAVLKRHRACTILVGTALVVIIAVGCGPVAMLMAQHLQKEGPDQPVVQWQRRNVIVVLGAGIETIQTPGGDRHGEPGWLAYPRLFKGMALYNTCRQTQSMCKILLSGGTPRGTVSETDTYRAALIAAGLPPDDIIAESKSKNTWQNAQFSKVLLDEYSPDVTVLVTSALHMRRSRLYFSHFDIAAIPQRSDVVQPVLSVIPSAYNVAIADFALAEYIGMLRYDVYNALGWNPPRVNAASPS